MTRTEKLPYEISLDERIRNVTNGIALSRAAGDHELAGRLALRLEQLEQEKKYEPAI